MLVQTTMQTSAGMSGTSTLSGTGDRALQAVDHALDKAAPAVERAAGAVHRTIDKATEAAIPAAEWVRRSGRQLANRSSQLTDSARGHIRARPLAAVAGALAIGFLAAKLMR
jgi:ElaB/YqjD/DUF883 family membrane-anchored ribosome-binding protein